MKMTPEQKAFFEYGKASEALKKRIAKVRHDARYVFGEPYCYLSSAEKENLWITSDLKSYIQDYRQKRAACRVWNPPEGRTCENCLHKGKNICNHPCFSCTPPNGSINNWEPRKEGK